MGAINIVFDGAPRPESGRFVEVEDDAEEVIFQIQRLSELLEALDFDRIHDLLSRLSAPDEVPKKAKRKSRGSG